MWHHATCIMKKANQIKSIDEIEGVESLRWEDQQKIRKYIDGNGVVSDAGAATRAPAAYGIEVSQTSRAACKRCSQKIIKGEVRISAKIDGKATKGLSWYHAACYLESFPSTLLDSLSGWQSLSSDDQASLQATTKGKAPSAETGQTGAGKSSKEPKARDGVKRKSAGESDQHAKIVKTESDMIMRKCDSGEAALETKLEAQARALWDLKDNLKKHVSNVELRQMLEANDQSTSGSELVLRDRCADGMMFGALKSCPMCSGHLSYSGSTYKCHGFISEWSKCSYSTTQPERIKGKWKIPEESDNQYLVKWFKSQKAAKPVRILPPSTPNTSAGNQTAKEQLKSSKDEKLGDLRVAITGLPKETVEEFRSKIEGAGGQVHAKIKKDTNCLVVGGGLSDQNSELKKARRMKIPVVREEYLANCIQKQKILTDTMTVESSSLVTVKVKGRSAVHEASGLQDSGHILEEGPSIYNTTLSLSDLSSGINSYYILQIIQDDKSSECYVFRKWGRVGNGGNKIEEMSKSDAIQEFKRLFLEKTGNPWEAWVHKQNFQKHPGRFFPLDIDYGVSKQAPKKNIDDKNSTLAPALKDLIKMLFNVETYRAAMMEFEINLSEMPLGKLSKSNIQKGFEALTQIQNLLENTALQTTAKESLIIDASNRFFTVIPSIHPHVIRDEDDFKSKVKMLEALQDIEIASRLVGFDVDSDDPLDAKYKKLRCDMAPLPHDSEDYQLIEKYLLTTHAPTHTDWRLELEEVFSLEREGEHDKFASQREKLGNRMLLWHGSRLTNFVGILSQGLRIAPPEAPATGYMFGKGVYFADLVSKSAQYCYTDRKNPVGLMLLSEVALGQVHELKKAQYMEKPPRGKHSTKGLGKKVPAEAGFAKWKDEVVVPCGKPVDSKVKSSELMYNEYIVYDTAQVKMQFLLKVRFHYKR
ncbi:poly [ADP-ribose] polymerase 1 isoform X2 [Beta vulgaris subsp. vulgaris]|nr:poly [ADP-ribose] polymerase 1 isoform X2 [Beta vulgaris subsp. vulgaris]